MVKTLSCLLKNLVAEESSWKITILSQWESIIGNFKNRVGIEAILDDQLILHVSHPALAQELLYLTPIIKQKINALIQQERIKKIGFKLIKKNQLTHQSPVSSHHYDNSLKRETCTVYSLTIQQYNSLALFKDAELRASFERFFIRCVKQGDHNERDEC